MIASRIGQGGTITQEAGGGDLFIFGGIFDQSVALTLGVASGEASEVYILPCAQFQGSSTITALEVPSLVVSSHADFSSMSAFTLTNTFTDATTALFGGQVHDADFSVTTAGDLDFVVYSEAKVIDTDLASLVLAVTGDLKWLAHSSSVMAVNTITVSALVTIVFNDNVALLGDTVVPATGGLIAFVTGHSFKSGALTFNGPVGVTPRHSRIHFGPNAEVGDVTIVHNGGFEFIAGKMKKKEKRGTNSKGKRSELNFKHFFCFCAGANFHSASAAPTLSFTDNDAGDSPSYAIFESGSAIGELAATGEMIFVLSGTRMAQFSPVSLTTNTDFYEFWALCGTQLSNFNVANAAAAFERALIYVDETSATDRLSGLAVQETATNELNCRLVNPQMNVRSLCTGCEDCPVSSMRVSFFIFCLLKILFFLKRSISLKYCSAVCQVLNCNFKAHLLSSLYILC